MTTVPLLPVELEHVLVRLPDPAGAAAWYVAHLSGRQVRGDGVVLGRAALVFERGETQPSEGSVIDHLAVSVDDAEATMQALAAAGGRILAAVQDVPGLFRLGFAVDPWGVKVEILEDPMRRGLHHVHLWSPEPERLIEWVAERVGGARTRFRDRFDALEYDALWLLTRKTDGAVAPGAGRVVDRLVWRVAGRSGALLEGPSGLRVELVADGQA